MPLIRTLLAFLILLISTFAQSPAPTPTVSLASLPVSTILPPLNASSPAFILALPAQPVFMTFNIISLANASVLPSAILSLSSSSSRSGTVSSSQAGGFTIIGSRTSLDPSSGGSPDSGNAKSRKTDVWLLEWDLGFANWTGIADDVSGVDEVQVLLGLGVQGNGTASGAGDAAALLQVAVSSTGE